MGSWNETHSYAEDFLNKLWTLSPVGLPDWWSHGHSRGEKHPDLIGRKHRDLGFSFPPELRLCVSHLTGPVCVCELSHFGCIWFFMTPWTVVPQAPLSMGFSRQEYWSGLPFPSPGDLPSPGMEPISLMSPALAGKFFTLVPPGKPWLVSFIEKSSHTYSTFLDSVNCSS